MGTPAATSVCCSCSSRSLRRATATTRNPAVASASHNAHPMPADAPGPAHHGSRHNVTHPKAHHWRLAMSMHISACCLGLLSVLRTDDVFVMTTYMTASRAKSARSRPSCCGKERTRHKRDFAAPAFEALRRAAVAGRALLQQGLLLLAGALPVAARVLAGLWRRPRSPAVPRVLSGALRLCLALSLRRTPA